MADSRFASSDEIVVDQLKINAKNKNTTQSTQTWLNVWEKWTNERKFNPKLEEYEHEDLYKKLQMFYDEVRIKEGFFLLRILYTKNSMIARACLSKLPAIVVDGSKSFSFPGCSLVRIVPSTKPDSALLVHGFTHD